MTQINLSEIKITPNQIWVKINNSEQCMDSFDVSQLLGHITEKTIKIISFKHNDHNTNTEGWKNHFMFSIDRLLANANHNRWWNIKDSIKYPYWLIDKIETVRNNEAKNKEIHVTIRNIMNEKLEDN